MKLTTQLANAAGGLALVVAASGAGGMAVADGLVKSSDIKDGTIKKVDLSDGVNDAINQVGATGPAGPAGPSGPSGAQGPAGVAGPSGLTGAFYAVAYYDVGNTNEGAVASVACDATGTDFTALAGGVQTLGLDDTPLDNNTPVSSSFPGRMDYSTNTPKPNRLDGWIVQFGGNAGTTPDRAPLRVKVWALCVPGSAVPVKQTYTQSQ